MTASDSNIACRFASRQRGALLFAVINSKVNVPNPTDNIVGKIDKLLEDDETFTTRVGLKFMTAVMRDALTVIGEIAVDKDKVKELDRSFTDFLKAQTIKDARAEEERTKWRWVTITPIVGIVIAEIARWILNKP